MNTPKRLLPLTLCLLTVGAAHADLIKQNAAGGYTRTFLMTDSANPALGKTGLTVAVKLRKVGGTYVATTNAATEVDSTNDPGRYQVVLTTTEVNTLGLLDYAFTATGANPDGAHDQIVGFDPSDSSLLGLTGVGTLANQTAIAAKTALIATNAADSPNTITAQSTTASTSAAVAVIPAAVWIYTASDGLTHQQSDALRTSILARGFAVSYTAATRTQVTTYFKLDGVTVLATTTVVYDLTGRAVSRTTVFTNLP